MPKTPVKRQHVNQAGRLALDAAVGIGAFLAGIARVIGRVGTSAWRAVEAVPTTLRLFLVALITLLFGIAGAIALDDLLSLICTVVVIPVCALTLGALGQRWYGGLGDQRSADAPVAAPAASDLQRSVEYVDKKLAVALTTFGTERHQQAVIALFQAKTAVELTLGTDHDSLPDVPVPADDRSLRPRIRLGSASTSLLRESPSMAAS